MLHDRQQTFVQVWLTHFVPCFFTGAILLLAIKDLTFTSALLNMADTGSLARYLLKAGINGTIVAILTLAFHAHRNRRIGRIGAASRFPVCGIHLRHAVMVGFLGGAMGVLLILHTWGILILTALVLGILFWNLRVFTRHVADMLKPDSVATWGDVALLLRVYLTMLTGFTLVNCALEGIHILAGSVPPFGFAAHGGDLFLNSLYYTVVTMTTLGFGDIVPKTWDGKLLLICQCLISYVMFALIIGIITRGVIRVRDTEDQ